VGKMLRNKEKLFIARNRIIYPNAVYHVTNRAPGREKLFLEDEDYLYKLSLIKKTASEFDWKVFCFCLMPNHIHLLFRIRNDNLSQGAKSLFEKYAKYFNAKYKRKGPVFCKPFRASLCEEDSYLLTASLYIHLNPLKAKIVNSFKEYRWTTSNLYTQKISPSTFIDYKFILNLIDKDLNKAKETYAELLKKSNEVEHKFIAQDENAVNKFRFNLIALKNISGISSFNGNETSNLWDEIEKFKTKKWLKDETNIKAKKYLIEQLLADGYKISEIGDMIGLTRQGVYRILQQGKGK